MDRCLLNNASYRQLPRVNNLAIRQFQDEVIVSSDFGIDNRYPRFSVFTHSASVTFSSLCG